VASKSVVSAQHLLDINSMVQEGFFHAKVSATRLSTSLHVSALSHIPEQLWIGSTGQRGTIAARAMIALHEMPPRMFDGRIGPSKQETARTITSSLIVG
jgi:hypothetical protein